jgi:hypothetical protein
MVSQLNTNGVVRGWDDLQECLFSCSDWDSAHADAPRHDRGGIGYLYRLFKTYKDSFMTVCWHIASTVARIAIEGSGFLHPFSVIALSLIASR